MDRRIVTEAFDFVYNQHVELYPAQAERVIHARVLDTLPDDVLVRITITNRGPDAAPLHVLPTLWFRNTWAWGRTGECYWPRPRIGRGGPTVLAAEHVSLGHFRLALGVDCHGIDAVRGQHHIVAKCLERLLGHCANGGLVVDDHDLRVRVDVDEARLGLVEAPGDLGVEGP